jgi:3-phosphoshikimate 1-carboxyvinyltransferase
MGTLKLASEVETKPADWIDIQLPWSKSHMNRLLLIDALAGRNPEQLEAYCDSKDSSDLLRALLSREEKINIGEGATPLRFLLAFRAVTGLKSHIEASGTLQQRKVGSIAEALRALGAELETAAGFAPVTLKRGINRFSQVPVDARRSSQAVSALMLIAPAFPGVKTILTPGGRVSETYIHMTAGCLEKEGIAVRINPDSIRIGSGTYNRNAAFTQPERDWSAAVFFLSLAVAMPGTRFHFPGLILPSLQGDALALEYWKPFGLKWHAEPDGLTCFIQAEPDKAVPDSINFSDVPDLAPAWIMAAAIGTQSIIRLEGTAHLSDKESNRMQRMAEGLAGWDINLCENDGHWMLDTRNRNIRALRIQTGGDHRIAMAFSTAAALTPVELDDVHCVAKSFPGFFNELEACNLLLQEKPV